MGRRTNQPTRDRAASFTRPSSRACRALLIAVVSLTGCGQSVDQQPASVGSARAPAGNASKQQPPQQQPPKQQPAKQQPQQPAGGTAFEKAFPDDGGTETSAAGRLPGVDPADAAPPNRPQQAPRAEPPLSAEEARALGLRRLDADHLILYTDLPSNPAVDELPRVFDLAVPQWCEYFNVPVDEAKGWRLIGSLIVDKERFLRARLLPKQLPAFLHGFQQGNELWLFEQPTPYYRRHLLLHEGVHGFMNWRFGGCGPPWYMEGMAELLGTHRWQNGELVSGYSPRSREEAPHWARVRIIQDDYTAGRGLPIDEVFGYGPQAHLKVEPYGWSWAAASFFDQHPAYQASFRAMYKHANDNGPFFNEQFVSQIGRDRTRLDNEWQVYIDDMQYGYDVARSAIDFRESTALPDEGAEFKVSAERGWQSSGIQLKAGTKYQVTASGQFQIAKDSAVWPSEANGVTIRYHRDRPLGCLLGAVLNWKRRSSEPTPLIKPIVLGSDGLLTPNQDGDLFLQLNDSPAERNDNIGGVTVRIVKL